MQLQLRIIINIFYNILQAGVRRGVPRTFEPDITLIEDAFELVILLFSILLLIDKQFVYIFITTLHLFHQIPDPQHIDPLYLSLLFLALLMVAILIYIPDLLQVHTNQLIVLPQLFVFVLQLF